MTAAFLVALLSVATQLNRPEPIVAWVDLVRQHEPGARDDAVFALAEWRESDLQEVLRRLPEYGRRHFPRDQRGQMNDLLKRGALLHTDLAMLAPQRARRFSGLAGWTSDQAIESSDGQALGARAVSGHWRFARTLLARVQPNPGRDDTVRAWYAAVAAHLQREREHAVAYQHLDEARRVLRADPQVWFYSGVLHETFASPSMQEAASGGRRTAIQPRRVELDAAARYLGLVVRADPGHPEARLRHGRVLHLLGRHERAIAELETAREAVQDGVLEYYADLYLGAAYEALGHQAEARACFERAAALWPMAQSPLLALSHLARQVGDRAQAVHLIEQIMALPSDPDGRDDPLWSYDVAALGDVDRLFSTLRAPFLTGDPP